MFTEHSSTARKLELTELTISLDQQLTSCKMTEYSRMSMWLAKSHLVLQVACARRIDQF
jgi:hypothetical protein